MDSTKNSNDMLYWKDYAKGDYSLPRWYNSEVKSASEIPKLVDKVIKSEQAEAEVPFSINSKDRNSLVKMATDYFNQFKTVNGNVVSAMISQGAY